MSSVYHEVEKENFLRWSPGKTGMYEVYYLTFNHLASGAGYWIRYTMNAPDSGKGEPYAQMWFSYFNSNEPARNFALRKTFPVSELKGEANPFKVTIGDNELTNGTAAGALSGSGRSVSWNLAFEPSSSVYYHLPRLFYKEGLAETVALSPNLDVKFRGEIVIDGETYAFNGDPGCQTHLWGKKHAPRWAWAHCSHFDQAPGVVFEAISVHAEKLGIKLPPLTFMTLRRPGHARGIRLLHHADFRHLGLVFRGLRHGTAGERPVLRPHRRQGLHADR
ncbi:MAG TPA: hypothetical protein PLQ76_03835, partial [bacterium]|nr:hypothetical protein [bacterium]